MSEMETQTRPIGEPEPSRLPVRVLIAEDEHLVAASLSDHLQHLGITVLGPVANGQEAIDLAKEQRPDMALLDIHMPVMDGLEAATVLFQRMGIPVMIVSAYSDQPYLARGAKIGVFGYLLKPVTRDVLRLNLGVAWSRFLHHQQLQSEVTELKGALEDRKLIERAKGVVMDKLKLSEAEAMKRLQRQARDTRRKLPDVARAILEAEQLFNPQAGAE
jgi:AmiR/NasT family two-component response regulator